MFGSSLPGARTTASSAAEGRLKSGALSKMKTKKRFGGNTVMQPKGGTGAIKQKEILKSAKFGTSNSVGNVAKSFGQKKVAGPTSTTAMGAGLPSSGGTDRAAAMVSKITNKLTKMKKNAAGVTWGKKK